MGVERKYLLLKQILEPEKSSILETICEVSFLDAVCSATELKYRKTELQKFYEKRQGLYGKRKQKNYYKNKQPTYSYEMTRTYCTICGASPALPVCFNSNSVITVVEKH
jgi:hypothetical protein